MAMEVALFDEAIMVRGKHGAPKPIWASIKLRTASPVRIISCNNRARLGAPVGAFQMREISSSREARLASY